MLIQYILKEEAVNGAATGRGQQTMSQSASLQQIKSKEEIEEQFRQHTR